MEDLSTATIAAPAATAPHRSFGAAAMAAVAVVGLAAGFGAGWAAHTSGSAASTPTIAVHGTLTLPDGGYSSVGSTCSGSGGYQDISAGVAVAIGNQTGKTLAVTSLAAGTFGGGGCQLAFSANVPAATTYTVTISHRGTQTFTPADVAAGFNLTLNGG